MTSTNLTNNLANNPDDLKAFFSSIRAVVTDMDGVIWRGATILPGTPDFFLFLRERGIPYMMATNNATTRPDDYIAKLEKIGIPATVDAILSSGVVTVDELSLKFPTSTPVYVVGSDALKAMIEERGYVTDPDNAQVVIAGLDRQITYEKIKIAGRLILRGAEFIGTNGDTTFPDADGFSPGAGTIIGALRVMTDRIPRLMGKPEPAMFETALRRLGTAPTETLMIGDRIDTDILGARRVGLRTALVLTGISSETDTGLAAPDVTFADLGALLAAWRELG
jgi:4-nitrophenyl phosphatase